MASRTLSARLAEFTERVAAPPNGLEIAWFHPWHPALDEALACLPEMETCPHELFRALMLNPGPARKRCALVTEHGVPVAVIGLRQIRRMSWESVTQWIVPAAVSPAKPGYLLPALEAVGSEVWVAWWRMAAPPPSSRLIRHLEAIPSYRLHCAADFEKYWRESGQFKTIRRVRNRCRDFAVAVNLPGSAEWTIRNWEARWRCPADRVDPALSDRLAAVKYLQDRQRHFTLMLHDRGEPIGGATMTVHHRDLAAGVLHREPAYHDMGIGDRLMELSLLYAAEHGFEAFDLGGGHHYKQKWAPQEGERWHFSVCPEALHRAKDLARWIYRMRHRNDTPPRK